MNIGIIRCEKNEEACPLTGCLNCLQDTQEGFADYDASKLRWKPLKIEDLNGTYL